MRVLFFCFLTGLLNAQVNLVKGPYLQIGTPNSVIVRWETDVPTDSKVEYDTSKTSMNYYAGNLAIDTLHEVQLNGLLPYTKYYYTIGTKTLTIQGDTTNYFVTSPVQGQEGKYRFWVTGDCGIVSANQSNCRNQYNAYNQNGVTNGWLLLGDNAYYSGSNSDFNTGFFAAYQSDIMKHAVLWPAPGNHDYNNGATTATTVPYYSIFTLPTNGEAGGVSSGTEMFYSYNYGNIHFVSLDSYGAFSGKRMYDTISQQATWLKQDLAANTSQWTVVYFHHPPYTMGSHNSDTEVALDSIRTYFVKILERYKVDLVLSGHSHDYERSKLMRGHYGYEASFVASAHNLSSSSALYDGTGNSCPYIKDSLNQPFGTVYVVSGSAGQLGGTQTSFPHDAMYYSNATDGGSFILDVEENRLDGKWLCADGVIRDHFTMFKNAGQVKTYTITSVDTITISATWPGNYIWSNGDTLRTTVISPTVNTTYWVADKFSCVSDTFKIVVLPAGVHELNPASGVFKIFPNPAGDKLTVELEATASDGMIEIRSVQGERVKMVSGKLLSRTNHEINTADLAEGVYLIVARINGLLYSEKLIISR